MPKISIYTYIIMINVKTKQLFSLICPHRGKQIGMVKVDDTFLHAVWIFMLTLGFVSEQAAV